MAQEVLDITEADFDDGVSLTRLSLDAVFRNINKNTATFLIWRLDITDLTLLPRDQYGIFFNKDAYLIYSASPFGHPSGGINAISREIKGKMEYHIHFWLGSYLNKDRAGIIAYKSVELDNSIGIQATQHREVQGRESSRFKSYFVNGFRILSAYAMEYSNYQFEEYDIPFLYQVKGRNHPVLIQMLDISWKHFCSSDIFLLQTHGNLFIWIGRATTCAKKCQGIKAALQLQSEQTSTCNITFVDDGYEKTLPDEDREIFERYLSLEDRIVRCADELPEEFCEEKRLRHLVKLYQCCDHQGKYRITEVKGGPLKQADLNHDCVMIVDHGINGVWIWVGRYVNDKERTEAIRNARGYVKKKKYPNTVPVTRVLDGVEPFEFQMIFYEWNEPEVQRGSTNKVPVVKITRFDALTMQDRPALAAKSQLIDDGTGEIKIWRIKHLEAIEVPKERFGVFFTGDCYTTLYTYKTCAHTRHIIYQWMGFHSLADDQGVAALKAIEVDSSKTDGKAMHARICQGREPVHFLQLFKGHLRVFNGRGTDFDVSGRNLKSSNHYLLLIQGTATYNTRATQVALKASSLNSNYCFVLRKGNCYYVWCGNSSTGDNREMAKGFVGTDFMLLLEGCETSEFWEAICGKHSYVSKKIPETWEINKRPRLFQCATATENFKAIEILHFSQKDLIPEDVMLLDAHHTVYLWIGNFSSSEEHRLSLDIAIEYLITDPQGRDMKTPIIQIRQGYEPPTFTGFFEKWDENLWVGHKSYDELRRDIESKSVRFLAKTANITDSEFDMFNKYSISVLRGPVDFLPRAVDPLRKELHLTYDDFVSLFNMDHKEFTNLPLWKRQEMKKSVGLF